MHHRPYTCRPRAQCGSPACFGHFADFFFRTRGPQLARRPRCDARDAPSRGCVGVVIGLRGGLQL
eukprot:4191896-Prymnesium_polylepis.1